MKNNTSDINYNSTLIQKIKMPSFNQLEKKVFGLFKKKYSISKYLYGTFVTNNIIYNEKSHLVAKFKDYLIIDDISEFLKRYYTYVESMIRLPRFFKYYHTYSKIFPNYTTLRESKYIYKNIYKKQKMIDLQQEEESEEKRKKYELENLKHQRKKNKQEINTIFDNDVYNSIIKQSQDLYMLLFGIEKNKKENINNDELKSSFNSLDIKNIIKSIEKFDYYSKNECELNNLKSKKSIKKENNSSLITKQSTINSSKIHHKIKKLKKVYKKNNNNIIISLKKLGIENLKILTTGKVFLTNENSKSKSKNKELKKLNKIKVNQKILIDDKINYLTERSSSFHKKQNTHLEFNNFRCFKKENLFNYKSTHVSKNNSIIKNIHINGKSSDFNYLKINNPKLKKFKKINVTSGTTESNYKSYKIKLLNRPHTKHIIDYKNRIKLSLREIGETIKINKFKSKHCNTERGSLLTIHKDREKEKINQNKMKYNLFKKINAHKKSFPSLDFHSIITRHLLLFQKNMCNSKINKNKKENLKINFNIRNNRKTKNNIDKNDEKVLYTEGETIILSRKREIFDKIKKNNNKFGLKNSFFAIKGIKIRHFNTANNSESKEKNNLKISKKINTKIKNSFHDNNKGVKMKRKKVSPIEKNNFIFKDNEKKKKYISKLNSKDFNK